MGKCKAIDTNKEYLDKRNVFEETGRNSSASYSIIPEKINDFNDLNESLSEMAVETYGLAPGLMLYEVEDKSKIRDVTQKEDGSIYRGATVIKYNAIPNKEMFEAIDENISDKLVTQKQKSNLNFNAITAINEAFFARTNANTSLSRSLLEMAENRSQDSILTTEKKIELLKSALNAEVLVDTSIEESGMLLPANHPVSIRTGKPVILINPNRLFADTVIHEFGHLYVDLLGYNDPLVQEAITMLKGTEFYNQVASNYPELDPEFLDKEVLATALGLEGNKIFNRELVKLTLWQKIKNKILDIISKMFNIQQNAVEKLAKEIMSNKTRLTGTEKFNTVVAQKSKFKLDPKTTNKQKAVADLFEEITSKFSKTEADGERFYTDNEGNNYNSSVTNIINRLKTQYKNYSKGSIEYKFDKTLITENNLLMMLNESELPLAFTKALDDFINNRLSTIGSFQKKQSDGSWVDAYLRDLNKHKDVFEESGKNELLEWSGLVPKTGDVGFINNVLDNIDVILNRAEVYQKRFDQAPIVGNSLHNAVENYVKYGSVLPQNINDLNGEFLKTIKEIIDTGKANGSVFVTEQILFSEVRGIPGTADLLEITKDGEVIIYDYKTISSFKEESGKDKSDYALYVYKGYMNQLLAYGKILNQYGITLARNPYKIIMAEVNYSGVIDENSDFDVKEVRFKNLSDTNLASSLKSSKERIDRIFGNKIKLDEIDIKSEIQDLSDIVNKINQYILIYKERTKNLRTGLNTKAIDKIQSELITNKLESDTNKYVSGNNEAIINSYVNNIHEALALLESQKMVIKNELTPEILQSLNYVLQTTEVLYDLKNLLDEEADIPFKDKSNLIERIEATIDFVENNKEFYKEMVKTLAINTLANNSNIMYGFHSEKYEIEARKSGLKTKNEIGEYVQNKLRLNKDSIDTAEVRYWTRMYKDGFTDLRKLEYMFADPGMIKSQFVQVVKNVLDHADMAIRNQMLEVMPSVANWFETLNMPGGDPKKFWKFAIDQKEYIDPKTGEKVKINGSRIISEFTSVYLEVYKKYQDQIDVNNKYIKELLLIPNKSKEQKEKIESLKKQNEEIYEERIQVLKKEKEKNEDYDKLTVNPAFSKLSEVQQEQIRFIHKNLKESDDRLNHSPEKKLIKSVQGGGMIYNLPRIRMSNLEAIKSGDNIKNFKSKIQDFVKPPSDSDEQNYTEEEFTQNEKFGNTVLDASGEEVFEVPVYYRNELEDENMQSYDIPTLLSLNHETTIIAQENKLIEADLFVIKESIRSENNSKIFKPDSWSNRKIQDKTGSIFQKSDQNLVYQAVKSSIDNRLYKRRYMGTYSKGNYRLQKGLEAISNYSSVLSLAGNFMSSLSTFSQGSIYRLMEGVVGEHMTMEDWKVGTKKAWKDLDKVVLDTQKYVPSSKTSLLIKKFGLETQTKALVNKFIQDNFLTKNLDQATLFSVTSIAEQMVTATLMYSLLNNVKALNKNGEFINAKGEKVSENEAMSLDDAYTVENGILKLNPHLVFTTKNVTEEYASGDNQDTTIAATEVSRYIRDVYADLYGQYNQDMKSVIQRNIFGKMAMSLRGWLPRGVHKRWRGITDVLSSDFMDFEQAREEGNIDKRYYSQDKKAFQEGNYVTTIRFIRSIMKEMKRNQMAFGAARQKTKSLMTTHELANLQRTQYELALMAAMTALALLLRAIATTSPDDEDKEKLYFVAYLATRINTELQTFLNPFEFFEMMKSPAVGITTIERIASWLNQMVGISFEDGELNFNIDDEYEAGAKEGENKALIKALGLIPAQVKYQQLKSILGLESDNTMEDSFEAQIKK